MSCAKDPSLVGNHRRSMALTKAHGHKTGRKSQSHLGLSYSGGGGGDEIPEPKDSCNPACKGTSEACCVSLADLQLQPAGWLCPSSVDKGPPQALLTVGSIARWASVDEVPQVLQTGNSVRQSPP